MTEPNAALPANEWHVETITMSGMGGEFLVRGTTPATQQFMGLIGAAKMLNDYEQEVKKLRAKAELADRFFKAQDYWQLEAWENNMDYQDWEHAWRADYGALKAKLEEENE